MPRLARSKELGTLIGLAAQLHAIASNHGSAMVPGARSSAPMGAARSAASWSSTTSSRSPRAEKPQQQTSSYAAARTMSTGRSTILVRFSRASGARRTTRSEPSRGTGTRSVPIAACACPRAELQRHRGRLRSGTTRRSRVRRALRSPFDVAQGRPEPVEGSQRRSGSPDPPLRVIRVRRPEKHRADDSLAIGDWPVKIAPSCDYRVPIG